MANESELAVRVWVPEVWDSVMLRAEPSWQVSRLKEEALRQATERTLDPRDYIVKFRGAAVLDEELTLAELGVPGGAPLVVLSARRHPVR